MRRERTADIDTLLRERVERPPRETAEGERERLVGRLACRPGGQGGRGQAADTDRSNSHRHPAFPGATRSPAQHSFLKRDGAASFPLKTGTRLLDVGGRPQGAAPAGLGEPSLVFRTWAAIRLRRPPSAPVRPRGGEQAGREAPSVCAGRTGCAAWVSESCTSTHFRERSRSAPDDQRPCAKCKPSGPSCRSRGLAPCRAPRSAC